MANIQVGDKVRVLAKDNAKGYRWEPSNSSKHLKLLKAEHLKDKLGIVIPAMRALPDDEMFVNGHDGLLV